MKTVQPLNPITPDPGAQTGHTFPVPQQDQGNPAADMIRAKLENIYSHEPDARAEAEEVEHLKHRPSKHQKFMSELSESGKSLAAIQTEWHNYYVNLPDDEKHQVWQEFYANNSRSPSKAAEPEPNKTLRPGPGHVVDLEPEDPTRPKRMPRPRKSAARSVSELKRELVGSVNQRSHAKLKAKRHLQSMAFGLFMGSVVVIILLFGFFNERFIAPFITPSRNVSATPIIIDPNSAAVGPEPKVIIPKINVEIPVVYDEPSIQEAAVQHALERGVIHYATTSLPGQQGNSVIFGHSSNNILNKGKYKFAFVLLSRLDVGDMFYLQKDGKRYAYKVFEKKVVKPSEVSVLDAVAGKVATATLITCDPPGTSLNRMVVVGEQISPDPSGNTASAGTGTGGAKPTTLAGNSPSLWSRLTSIFR